MSANLNQDADLERQPLLPPALSTEAGESSTPPPGYSSITPPKLASPPAEPVGTVPEKEKSAGWKTALLWGVCIAGLGLLAAFVIRGSKKGGFEWRKSLKDALGGGLSGAAAMVVQVLTLMPLRTVMNYQYRFGHTFAGAVSLLWQAGKIPRFYSGLSAAIFQGPLSRFGDTFANAGIESIISSLDPPKWTTPLITIFASLAAALFRMILTPIDTLKTTLQAQGPAGIPILKQRVRENGIGSLWYGAFATAAATFVGHYPWFATYNSLKRTLPLPAEDELALIYLRQAFIGFIASIASDTVSNWLRILKTYRQVDERKVSYTQALKNVYAAEGLNGVLFRGLPTRLLANGLQGLMFSVLWKLFADLWSGKHKSFA
ncbi:mitochondrial carrier [Atractiella rhizophila]|nr:mitochondrial carrier [Atractiella rhizophila]